MEFGVLNVLKDQQEGSSNDGSGIFHQIVLCLLLNTQVQQVSHEVNIIQWQYLLGA